MMKFANERANNLPGRVGARSSEQSAGPVAPENSAAVILSAACGSLTQLLARRGRGPGIIALLLVVTSSNSTVASAEAAE